MLPLCAVRKKRRGAVALQGASRRPGATSCRAGVVDCVGPPRFFGCSAFTDGAASRRNLARAPFLEPEDVLVRRRRDHVRDQAALDQRRHGPRIQPTADFGMAVGKRQADRSVMVTRTQSIKTGGDTWM